MKLQKQTFSFPSLPNFPNLPNFQKAFLFDIETTGLSPKTSYIYLIGVLFFQENSWHSLQWLAQNRSEESEILQHFLKFCNSYSQMIHFNGRRFDLPFLLERCRQLHILCPLTSFSEFDLYQVIRPLKHLLNLEKLNQMYLESFLGVCRLCPYTDKDLISFYQQYQSSFRIESEQFFFQHNLDDLKGMISLLSFLSYQSLQEGAFSLQKVSCVNHSDETDYFYLEISVLLTYAVPVPISFQNQYGILRASKNKCLFWVQGKKGTMKHFFTDYKHYDYLPFEERVIHKSLSAYVDRSHRRSARAEECYVEKTGLFLPQKTSLYTPCFQEMYRAPQIYFEYTKDLFSNLPLLLSYIQSLFLQ